MDGQAVRGRHPATDPSRSRSPVPDTRTPAFSSSSHSSRSRPGRTRVTARVAPASGHLPPRADSDGARPRLRCTRVRACARGGRGRGRARACPCATAALRGTPRRQPRTSQADRRRPTTRTRRTGAPGFAGLFSAAPSIALANLLVVIAYGHHEGALLGLYVTTSLGARRRGADDRMRDSPAHRLNQWMVGSGRQEPPAAVRGGLLSRVAATG